MLVDYLQSARRRAGIAVHRGRLALHPRPQPVDQDQALADLPTDPHVLFLCFGNICRSPMAERYLQSALDEHDVDGVSVDSAGFFDTEGRSSPDAAVTAAAEFGVDLEPHQSRRVTTNDLRESDLILVMDAFNHYQFERQFDGEAYYLGAFGEDSDDSVEISDPYDHDLDTFRSTYGEIAARVDSIAAELTADDGRSTR